jgi:lysophospholipase L1-like esterase
LLFPIGRAIVLLANQVRVGKKRKILAKIGLLQEGLVNNKHFYRLNVLCSLLLALILLITLPLPVSAQLPLPNSMAALGDSITIAYNTGSFPFTGAPQNSWSTGTNSTVNSMYLRFSRLNRRIVGKYTNLGVSGAKVADLNAQAAKISSKTEYVTILIGANDVCASSESTMTSTTAFQGSLTTALNTIKSRAPRAQIYIVSIPNIYRLWEVLKGSAGARSAWTTYQICQSMLANPTSTLQSDIDRRLRVSLRNQEFNNILKAVCESGAYACRFDNYGAYNTDFLVSDVSTRDYFHPSISGQAKLAAVAWANSGY